MQFTNIFIKRFFSRFTPEPNTGCWLWCGPPDKDGYGRITLFNKTLKAHRVSFIIHNKDENIDNHLICHKCDTRSCVNPSHLYKGTYSDNIKDRDFRKRGVFKRGEKHYASKISDKTRLEIFTCFESGMSISKIAKKFKTSYKIAYSAVHKKHIWCKNNVTT